MLSSGDIFSSFVGEMPSGGLFVGNKKIPTNNKILFTIKPTLFILNENLIAWAHQI